METNINTPQSFFEKNKVIIKGFLIGFLILLMLIPSLLLLNLVNEREQRQSEVINEISSKWASDQTIVGPALVIPYKEFSKTKEGKSIESVNNIILLPEMLQVNGTLLPEVRHRSLYDVTLYRSSIKLNGTFSNKDLKSLQLIPENILWKDAKLVLGLDDARGLEEEVALKWNTNTYTMNPGIPSNKIIEKGLASSILFNADSANAFEIELKLKGSERLYFTPVGKTSLISLSSKWKDPAFDGQYLPTSHKVSDSGFSAQWKVLNVSRNYPQAWLNTEFNLKESAFGVRLVQPTDNYAKTERSVKYAILFIALTFTVFFFLEIIQKKQIHPLQYLLVGFSLCVFYTLLLSISEYTGFNLAYLIAACATVFLIGLYVWSIFKKGKVALGFTAALGGLYAYIFILIQLQDYALLFGSIGLFVIIAVLMYFSRKIDWYGISQG